MDELEEWRHIQDVKADFNDLAGEIREELSELYRSGVPAEKMREQKAAIFAALLKSLENLRKEKWQDKQYYQSWFEEPLNNARLALYSTYEGSHCAFAQLWLEANENPVEFHRLAEKQSRLKKEERREWLKQSCPAIAPKANL
mgnify:CR=1 FL=1